jgi:hypothetical protein
MRRNRWGNNIALIDWGAMSIKNDVAFGKRFEVAHSFLNRVIYEIMRFAVLYDREREISDAHNKVHHLKGLLLHTGEGFLPLLTLIKAFIINNEVHIHKEALVVFELLKNEGPDLVLL